MGDSSFMNKKLTPSLIVILLVSLFLSTAQFSVDGADENSWTTMEPMSTARGGLGVAVVNGKIYAIGGANNDTQLGVTEEYNPVTDTWTTKESMPTPRSGFAIAVYQNKIYCIGGMTGDSENYVSGVTGKIEVYDPATDTWETKAPMPTARSLPGANIVAGKIYLIGGRIGTHAYQSTLANEVYDPDADSWTTKTPAPIRITSLGSAVFNNQIYFIATRSTKENPAQGALILTYNPFTDSWSLGKSSPTYASSCAIGVASDVKASKGIYFFDESATHIYDPLTESWINDTSMPTARGYAGVAVLDDDFFIIGGIFAPYEGYIVMTNSATTNEKYTPIGNRTLDESPSPTPTPSPEPTPTPQHRPEPFPTVLIAIASIGLVAGVGAGLRGSFKTLVFLRVINRPSHEILVEQADVIYSGLGFVFRI